MVKDDGNTNVDTNFIWQFDFYLQSQKWYLVHEAINTKDFDLF